MQFLQHLKKIWTCFCFSSEELRIRMKVLALPFQNWCLMSKKQVTVHLLILGHICLHLDTEDELFCHLTVSNRGFCEAG